ncbi:tRNA dihydrouridine(20/20a) synthase DusA [Acidithiobacillus sp. IBUN Pt1247-S3]|uniref:tRNA dihydrouridine(20/20a) synthase DusA n=1 Tax=Acidithiobacillus sp. IBUN Pt1247-S3 TaxID=3166642 RepID=UPI0034E4C381
MKKTLSIAPMMDWTDRHCRAFLRLVCPSCVLYTEMVTTPAILLGKTPERYLGFSALEQPVILQLGGEDPEAMARAAQVARDYGYTGLNLNCGCPSPRVQKGRFGACLMQTPALVRELMDALASSGLPVSVKHRLGLDRQEDYASLARFVETVSAGACQHFIVHARNAWLKGLNPAANREVPPLRWDWAAQLKQTYPHLRIELNGGLRTVDQVLGQLPGVDGVMLGRAAYHQPLLLAEIELALGRRATLPTPAELLCALEDYAGPWGETLPAPRLTRHLHGLYYGTSGAKAWRRYLGTARPTESAWAFLQRSRHWQEAEMVASSPSRWSHERCR